MEKAKKVALVGLDGIIPEFAEKFMAEGVMPNLKKLKEQGFYTESIPSLSVWTPTNWATIVTGAQTSTHGIDGFEIHLPGEPLPFEVYHRGFDSDMRRAETFWEAATKKGKKVLLLKFPGTWPPRLKEGEGVQIAGAALHTPYQGGRWTIGDHGSGRRVNGRRWAAKKNRRVTHKPVESRLNPS